MPVSALGLVGNADKISITLRLVVTAERTARLTQKTQTIIAERNDDIELGIKRGKEIFSSSLKKYNTSFFTKPISTNAPFIVQYAQALHRVAMLLYGHEIEVTNGLIRFPRFLGNFNTLGIGAAQGLQNEAALLFDKAAQLLTNYNQRAVDNLRSISLALEVSPHKHRENHIELQSATQVVNNMGYDFRIGSTALAIALDNPHYFTTTPLDELYSQLANTLVKRAPRTLHYTSLTNVLPTFTPLRAPTQRWNLS